MRLLLDTHMAIWAFTDSDALPQRARQLLLDGGNTVCCSVASVWEVQIKHASHPGNLPLTPQRFIECCKASRFERLAIAERHVLILDSLRRAPGAAPHKDLFDRLLVCQAKADGLVLLTHDAKLSGYDEPCVLVV